MFLSLLIYVSKRDPLGLLLFKWYITMFTSSMVQQISKLDPNEYEHDILVFSGFFVLSTRKIYHFMSYRFLTGRLSQY